MTSATLLIVTLLICCCVAVDLPVVQILSWMEADDHKWKSGSEMEVQGITHNKTTFIIPGDIYGLTILCNASYPILWEFAPDEHLDTSAMVFNLYSAARREGDGSKDSPFRFSMKLVLYGDTNAFTGKYICRKADADEHSFFADIQTQIYLFWEGNSPPYLMGAGKTVKVSSLGQGSVTLPCPVAFPEVDVFLQRKINVTNKNNMTELKFVDVEFNSNTSAVAPITFDPTVGFMMGNTIDRNKSIDGEYKCLTAEKDDVVTVVVVGEKIPPTEQSGGYKLEGGAKVFYNKSSEQFVCCSSSDKAPTIFSLWCSSYVHCRIATPLLSHNMVEKMKVYSYWGRSVRGNCVSNYMYQGAYRCVGDGVDVTKVAFTTHDYNNGTYTRDIFWSWDEITAEKQQKLVVVNMQIERGPDASLYHSPWTYYQVGHGPSPTLYSGQNISFSCQPANFYFADGVAWKIKWKNNTSSYVPIVRDPNESGYWYWIPPRTVHVIVNTQIHSMVCMAPIWNSTDWVHKEYVLNTKDPSSVELRSPNAPTLYWTLNDTEVSIQCDGTGDPPPQMAWLKNGKVVVNTSNVKVIQSNGTLTLKFLIASYDVHGEYLCVAENIASKAEKRFSVFVQEGHPVVATVVVTCVCVTLVAVLGVLGWRFKVNHDTASELRWRTS